MISDEIPFYVGDRELYDYEAEYKERLLKHIDLVNKYALKVYRSVPDHDYDKKHALFRSYSYFMKKDLTPEEKDKLDKATFKHVTGSGHHPEHWSPSDISGFTRENPNPHGTVDAYAMPPGFIQEMCADWCAVSEEKGTSPYDWADKVIGSRWAFSEFQIGYIYKTLEKMWGER